MKKLLTVLLALTLIILPAEQVFAADKDGKLISIEDVITKNGENANIKESITAITDSNGKVDFPSYKDSKINKITIENGTQNGDVELIKNGDIEYNSLNFTEKNKEVKFSIEIIQEKTYVEKAAKIGSTFPQNVKLIEFKEKNNSPLNIENYTINLAAPNGYELLHIVDFNPEKQYEVFQKDGQTFGKFEFKKVKCGSDMKLSINVYNKNKTFNYIVWALAIVISILFMIKNRDLLEKAKEEKLKTKN
ncbi:hypothetical protein [Clostridium uliginosum]|uniref:Uncharacterized protein n=1 Tax=Clostridium uliginosum TaxID=119641 RepID=A0A1I1N9W6_9CLOT|nr:hypothetical protein [Clostridium uliginosum]SFC94042.1 hypothetical protein SAMN05421842_11443 [Clostridium uliginosum]